MKNITQENKVHVNKYEKYNKEQLIQHIIELEKQLKSSKYGLYWDKTIDSESNTHLLINSIPYLYEIADKKIVSSHAFTNNLLVEGDNYHALTVLNMINDGNGIFDMIYIDPPYNTGNNDFIYNDNYVSRDDGYRHSKWLRFMEVRLKLARELLLNSGAIFISIDDNEFAQLKLLCDSIFGESNFVDCLVWDKKSSAKGVPPKNMIVNVHEYILVYQKSSNFSFVGEVRKLDGFSNPDNDPRGPWRNTNIKSTIKSKDKGFSITDPKTGKEYYDAWAYSKEELDKLISENVLIFPKKTNGQVRRKEYFNEFKNSSTPIKSSLGLFDNQKNTEMLKNMLPDVLFLNPKPMNLMKYLIKVSTNKNAKILDFFAGSGTTGHAVMEINKEEESNRSFILCTNNENNICTDVTYPRLRTVISGLRKDGSKYGEKLNANLHYYKCKFIPNVFNSDQAKYDLVEKVNNLLCISENVYELVDSSSKYYIYQNISENKKVFMYIDYYDLKSFEEFKSKIILTKMKIKVVYMFSTDNVVDELLYKDIEGIEIKPIPSKIYEIYKEIVEEIKRG